MKNSALSAFSAVSFFSGLIKLPLDFCSNSAILIAVYPPSFCPLEGTLKCGGFLFAEGLLGGRAQ